MRHPIFPTLALVFAAGTLSSCIYPEPPVEQRVVVHDRDPRYYREPDRVVVRDDQRGYDQPEYRRENPEVVVVKPRPVYEQQTTNVVVVDQPQPHHYAPKPQPRVAVVQPAHNNHTAVVVTTDPKDPKKKKKKKQDSDDRKNDPN